jgi:hypothetical protein
MHIDIVHPISEVLITSPPDREDLVVELWSQDYMIAEINSEGACPLVEIYPRPDGKPWNFNADQLLEMLEKAKRGLPAKMPPSVEDTLINALNEVCNGPEAIPDWEFQTRMGVTRIEAQSILEKLKPAKSGKNEI